MQLFLILFTNVLPPITYAMFWQYRKTVSTPLCFTSGPYQCTSDTIAYAIGESASVMGTQNVAADKSKRISLKLD